MQQTDTATHYMTLCPHQQHNSICDQHRVTESWNRQSLYQIDGHLELNVFDTKQPYNQDFQAGLV